MKVLYSRITEAIKTKPKIENLCDDLTLIGIEVDEIDSFQGCLLYTSPSPRDLSTSRMPSSA